jgi:CHASE2 domain-containing sensor protein
MGKLVVLRLDGDALEQGFRVTLAIAQDGTSHPAIEMTGYLPPAPELATHLQNHWFQKYRSLAAPYRIKPISITYDGSVNPRSECIESANELRSRLIAWLDSDSFRCIDRRLREELNRDETIRFLIRTDDKHLQKLPWHLWDLIERYPKAEVALSSTESERIKPSPTRKTKIKILAILGHSDGIDIEADRQLLENLPNAEITFLAEPKHHEINDQLWEQAWDIIFFAGHSETEGETGRIYINPTDSLTVDELWFALRKAVERGLKLAIFNSCDGLGLARRLNDLHIPQMIVMRELVPDQVAQEFLKYFLTAFADGKPFYLAVRDARERLQGLESECPCASWLPIIYQNLAQDQDSLIWPKPSQRWWRGLQRVLVASVAVTGLVMGVRVLGLLQSVELKAFDQMMQLRPAEKPDPRLLVVQVTAEDIAKLGGEYPLQDKTLLRLLRKLEEYQPRVIGLDMFRDRPEGEGHAELVKYLKGSERIVPICTVPSTKVPQGVAPPPGISDEQPGFADVVSDPDDVVRRHLLAMKPPAASSCSTYYALSFQVAHHYLKSKGIPLEIITKNQLQLGSSVLKRLEAHTGFYHKKVSTDGFQFLLNYRSNQSLREITEHVTLTDVLTNRIQPDFVKDKIILIGVTDPTIKDNFNTPFNQEIRGLLLHTQMVSQILSAVEDKRPLLWFLPLWVDAMWILAWSFAGGILTLYLMPSPKRLGLTGTVALISLNGICLVVLLTNGCILPLIPSLLALVATGGSMVARRTFQSQKPQ